MVVGIAVAAFAVVMAGAVGAIGAGIAIRLQVAGAADAAALAAAPVTFAPFGATGTPEQEAARFARLNGSRLVRCRCPIDRSWRSRTVSVVVERPVAIPLVGRVTIRASSRATFEPTALIPLASQPDDAHGDPDGDAP
jgi:hypothetical protein